MKYNLVRYIGFNWDSLTTELKLWAELQIEMKLFI